MNGLTASSELATTARPQPVGCLLVSFSSALHDALVRPPPFAAREYSGRGREGGLGLSPSSARPRGMMEEGACGRPNWKLGTKYLGLRGSQEYANDTIKIMVWAVIALKLNSSGSATCRRGYYRLQYMLLLDC